MKFIVNEKVTLSPLKSSDADAITQHINDEEIHKNTLSIPFPYHKEDAEKFLSMALKFEDENGKQREWAIRFKGQLIGCIGLLYNHGINTHKSEIGYWLGEKYWRKGIMTLAIKKIIKYGFETWDIVKIYAKPFSNNRASQNTLMKAGMKLEAKLKNAIFKNEQLQDEYIYSIIA